MLKLAVEGNPNFEISDVELKRKGVSYTIDTVKAIKTEMSLKNNEIFYLIGSDSLLEFQHWKEPEGILNKCQVIVAIRPGFRPSDIPSRLGSYNGYSLQIFPGLKFHLRIFVIAGLKTKQSDIW